MTRTRTTSVTWNIDSELACRVRGLCEGRPMLSVLTLVCPLGPRAQQMPLFAVAESRDQGSSLGPGSCLLHVPEFPLL